MQQVLGRTILFALATCVLILAFALAMKPQSQVPSVQSTPVPMPKLPVRAKKEHIGFPPVPTFQDLTKEAGLTVSHISAPEALYVIDSTSGGVGVFDCDDDGRLDLLLINGSTVDRLREGGDPMVTLYHQERDGTFKDIPKEVG